MNSTQLRQHLSAELTRMLRETVGEHALPGEVGEDTRLLGTIPELDSMALLGLLTQVEERFDVRIDDALIEAGIFETFGSLRRFVERLVDPDQRGMPS